MFVVCPITLGALSEAAKTANASRRFMHGSLGLDSHSGVIVSTGKCWEVVRLRAGLYFSSRIAGLTVACGAPGTCSCRIPCARTVAAGRDTGEQFANVVDQASTVF